MKTLLIGLDGATFSILDPFMEEGIMPFLKGLVDSGARAALLSTPNPLTPPAWASVMTGRSPGSHGVFDFLVPVETVGRPLTRLVDSRDLRAETIWSMAGRQERSVISLNFPLMFPPSPLNGFMIPGFVSWRLLRRAVYPPDLFQSLKDSVALEPRGIAWDLEMEEKAVRELPEERHEEWIRFHILREKKWMDILRHLMLTHPSDLTAILFDGVDKLQHLCWPLLDGELFPPEPSAREKKTRELCLDYFRQMDGFLEEISHLAGPEARTFIVSDHGFGPTRDVFFLNVWLAERGYLQWQGTEIRDPSSDPQSPDPWSAAGPGSRLIDWEKTVAFALTPSSNGITIRISGGAGEPGISADAYEHFRDELIAGLLAYRSPASGEPVVKEVLKREEVFPGRHMRLAPDLTLVLRDHGFISVGSAPSPVVHRPEPKGMHRPEGIFIAAGPGIERGAVLPRPLRITQVCPALLYSLGMEIPAGLEDPLPADIFTYELRSARPVLRGGASGDPLTPTKSDDTMGREEQEEVLKQLRALGYIE